MSVLDISGIVWYMGFYSTILDLINRKILSKVMSSEVLQKLFFHNSQKQRVCDKIYGARLARVLRKLSSISMGYHGEGVLNMAL